MTVDEAPDDEGEGAPRQSHNFAPGYSGVVYRADVPDRGAGPSSHQRSRNIDKTTAPEEAEQEQGDTALSGSQTTQGETHYKLQAMKWGLIPFWTKRNPGYASMLKTINCRDDSLATAGGMWASMKARKRCVVIAQGFFEWLKPNGSKEKIPHYIKRKDGKLLCLAGLWDCVQYEDDEEGRKVYSYTIITTDSNAQLKFLHDRMPVVLEPASEAMNKWLDPGRYEWTSELQSLLKPYTGELEVYPVSKEVGKVGNDSPSFLIPVASKENKNNIANFFAKGAKKGDGKKVELEREAPKGAESHQEEAHVESVQDAIEEVDKGEMNSPVVGDKRPAEEEPVEYEPSSKKPAPLQAFKSPVKEKQQGRGKISATSNNTKSPSKKKALGVGSQKITKFFGNSA